MGVGRHARTRCRMKPSPALQRGEGISSWLRQPLGVWASRPHSVQEGNSGSPPWGSWRGLGEGSEDFYVGSVLRKVRARRPHPQTEMFNLKNLISYEYINKQKHLEADSSAHRFDSYRYRHHNRSNELHGSKRVSIERDSPSGIG